MKTHRSTTDSGPFEFNLEYSKDDFDAKLWDTCVNAGVLVPIVRRKGGKAKGAKDGNDS